MVPSAEWCRLAVRGVTGLVLPEVAYDNLISQALARMAGAS
jgi:hypothetical protein